LVGDRAGGHHPTGGGPEDLHHPCTVEPLGGGRDLRAHQLARKAAGDEDNLLAHAADDAAAVRDALEFQFHGAHAPPPSSEPRPGSVPAHSFRDPIRGREALRARSRAEVDDRSWYGTLMTITPAMKCNRVRMNSAVWLCRTASHQWPTTYSGM